MNEKVGRQTPKSKTLLKVCLLRNSATLVRFFVGVGVSIKQGNSIIASMSSPTHAGVGATPNSSRALAIAGQKRVFAAMVALRFAVVELWSCDG